MFLKKLTEVSSEILLSPSVRIDRIRSKSLSQTGSIGLTDAKNFSSRKSLTDSLTKQLKSQHKSSLKRISNVSKSTSLNLSVSIQEPRNFSQPALIPRISEPEGPVVRNPFALYPNVNLENFYDSPVSQKEFR